MNTNFDTSFNTRFYDFTVDELNVEYVFNFLQESNRVEDPTEEGGLLYKYTQEYDSTGQMSAFKSIVIRSNSLPIRNEGITLKNKVGQISGGSVSIITDFEIDQGSIRNQKCFIHYIPTAEYRRINMFGNTPLKHISIEILWTDNDDNIYPVLIPEHDKATVKLYFEEK